jgi:hypothetical protein
MLDSRSKMARPERRVPVSDHLDPTVIPFIILLVWPVTRSAVFVAAAMISLWSRSASRRAQARRLLRMLSNSGGDS